MLAGAGFLSARTDVFIIRWVSKVIWTKAIIVNKLVNPF